MPRSESQVNRSRRQPPKMTDVEVAQKADEEGLGYFVQHYTNGDEFESAELRTMHKKAQAALKEYEDALDKIRANIVEDDD